MSRFNFDTPPNVGQRNKGVVDTLQDLLNNTTSIHQSLKDDIPRQVDKIRKNLVKLQRIEMAIYRRYFPVSEEELQNYFSDLYTNKDPQSAVTANRNSLYQADGKINELVSKMRETRPYIFRELERVENQIKMAYDKLERLEELYNENMTNPSITTIK